MLFVSRDEDLGCMTYHEFLLRLTDGGFADPLEPLRRVLEKVKPGTDARGRRLADMRDSLRELRTFCEDTLQLRAPAD